MIYRILHLSHQFKTHLGETTSTILFLALGHHIDMIDKLITFTFSVGAGLIVHLLKEVKIGQILINYFRNKNHDKKN